MTCSPSLYGLNKRLFAAGPLAAGMELEMTERATDSQLSRDAPNTADRILDAAEALFAQRGLAGTAVRDIAARTGLNPASLYNHFPSKQALYEAVLERGVVPLIEVLREAARAESDSREEGLRYVDAVMAHLERTPHLPRLIQHEVLTGGEHLAGLAKRWVQPLVAEGLAALKRQQNLAGWEDEELPFLISAWLHLIFGHFAMAPLLDEVFGKDSLSHESLIRQTRFLRKVAQRLMGEDE